MARGDDITDCGPAACPVPACEDDPTTNNRDSQSELWYAWRQGVRGKAEESQVGEPSLGPARKRAEGGEGSARFVDGELPCRAKAKGGVVMLAGNTKQHDETLLLRAR